MKKSILITTLIFSLLLGNSFVAFAAENEKQLNLAENVKSAILIEQDTGEILFDKNTHDQLPPASMTKIMTMLLIMEELDQGTIKLDEFIRISDRAASMGGSQIFLGAGEEMTVEDLLKGIAIASGNDASVALAERISGSEEAFVEKMNEKASQLNLENTNFQNSSGLPAKNQYSSAHDLAIMAKELLKYESITSYTSIYEDYLRKGDENEFWLVNTNKLVRFYPGVDGLKTGYTSEAKYGLTATAKKDDMRVIAVVMGADTVKQRNATVSQMLDYSFNHFNTKKLFEKEDVITSISDLKSENNQIDVITNQSISVLYKKGEKLDQISTNIVIKKPYNIPINRGDEIGVLTIKNGEDVVSKSTLTVKEDVVPATYLTLIKRSIQKLVKFR